MMVSIFITAEAQLDFHLKRFNEVTISMASKPEKNINLITSSTSTSTASGLIPAITTTTIATTRTTAVTKPTVRLRTISIKTLTTTTTTTTSAPTPAINLKKTIENRGKMRLHHLHLQNKNADRGSQFHKNNVIQVTTPITAVVLEKVLVTTHPVVPAKFGLSNSDNVNPQKTIDYNSIAEEFTDQNDTVIDLIMQTQLKTEPITTPEPRMFLSMQIDFRYRLFRILTSFFFGSIGFCIVQRPRQSDQLISVNSARRVRISFPHTNKEC